MTGNDFGTRLANAVQARGALCPGIDPHPELLRDWGLTVDATGLERFALTAAEAFGDTASIVKPQSAFFEAFGSAGIAVLERTIAVLHERGALVLLDAKRGDIGSTMAAYAQAYLTDGSPLAADALTVSPFLGFSSLDPAIQAARHSGRGLFVLCRTSNPLSDQVQLAAGSEGVTIAQGMVDNVADLNTGSSAGSFGLVIGATVRALDVDLSELNGPILAPGIGAQGAGLDDLRTLFGSYLPSVLPNSSRQILATGPDPRALRAAVNAQNEALRG